MSTNGNSAARKTLGRSRYGVSRGGAKQPDLDEIRLRLFEPKREKREVTIDVAIWNKLEEFEAYLTDKFGQKPASSKVIELLLEDALKANSEFESRRRGSLAKRSAGLELSEAEADEVVETIGVSTKAKASGDSRL